MQLLGFPRGASNLTFDNPTGNNPLGQDVTAANASSSNQQVTFNPNGDFSIYGSSGNTPPLSFNLNGDLSIWGGDSNYSFAGSNNQLGFEPNLRGYIIANPEEFSPGDAGTGGPFGPVEGAGEGAPPEGMGPAGEPGAEPGSGLGAESGGNTASPTPRPDFPPLSGGRSGGNVKNLIGPPNSVMRGTGNERVFVTNDEGQVIFDITRERVKQVIPGQGFVGSKRLPTLQEINWINSLWRSSR